MYNYIALNDVKYNKKYIRALLLPDGMYCILG